MKPLVFDLFCGLGGWTQAFLAEGYRCIGFDIEAHDYGSGGYPGELVLADISTLAGVEMLKKYGVPNVIVASPPCQAYSYMAMPWLKAKEKRRKILADPKERERLNDLFNHCFRIQREVSDAAGRYVPMVVENVRGAQDWVGKAQWHFGSYYLWGDVPALMPIPGKVRKTPEGSWDTTRQNYNPDHKWDGVKAGDRNKGAKNGEHKWSNSFADTLKGEGNKTAGMNWSDRTIKGQDFTRIAGQQAAGVKLAGNNGPRRWEDRDVKRLRDATGLKERDNDGYDYPNRSFGRKAPATSSKSPKRKQASAEIAKIPFPLAQWIARTFKPKP
jgi:hypothetical protein